MKADSTPEIGDKRTRKGFLFIARTAQGLLRWLEYAEWEEEFFLVKDGDLSHGIQGEWVTMRWLDLSENEYQRRMSLLPSKQRL